MQILNNLLAGRRRIDPPCVVLGSDHFERISMLAVRAAGGRWGFRLALFLILAWGISGPYFRYHESWTRTFTVVTTSVTFLLVFLIQNCAEPRIKSGASQTRRVDLRCQECPQRIDQYRAPDGGAA